MINDPRWLVAYTESQSCGSLSQMLLYGAVIERETDTLAVVCVEAEHADKLLNHFRNMMVGFTSRIFTSCREAEQCISKMHRHSENRVLFVLTIYHAERGLLLAAFECNSIGDGWEPRALKSDASNALTKLFNRTLELLREGASLQSVCSWILMGDHDVRMPMRIEITQRT